MVLFGIQLLENNDVKDLNIIERNCPQDADKCCTIMFQLWLERNPSASWEDLIHALEIIGLKKVANKVLEFCGKIY